MRVALQYISWLVGFPLNLLVIATLLRGAYRRFPFVLAYSIALFLTGVVEVAAYAGYFSGARMAFTRARYYWVDEGIRQGLLFAVVISLLYQATSGVRARALVRTALIAGAILVASISFLVHYDSQAAISRWLTLWSRDLNFSSALLDLALWGLLVAARKYDWAVLMLSGALGIQFTGEAIGQALRNQFPSNTVVADIINIGANWACPYIWWQVFRGSPAPKASIPAGSPNS
ncbi:MAG: hypothetical protein LAP40_16115 [Acidobacteriia bacterium]|nr:hypothetical protein [Terriglobia bacterium]